MGFKQAMALKAVKLNKGDVPVVVRLVCPIECVCFLLSPVLTPVPVRPVAGGGIHRHCAATAGGCGPGPGARCLVISSGLVLWLTHACFVRRRLPSVRQTWACWPRSGS